MYKYHVSIYMKKSTIFSNPPASSLPIVPLTVIVNQEQKMRMGRKPSEVKLISFGVVATLGLYYLIAVAIFC
jgi:hypothetical protein